MPTEPVRPDVAAILEGGRRDTRAATMAQPPGFGPPPGARHPEYRPPRVGPDSRPAVRPAAPDPAGQRWPVQPLPGEPPLTLFRGKRIVELATGTEIDRFGDPDGNLTYAAGTPFSKRSLVPDWINRSYHTYRVARPIQAVTGTAIPWFDQAGGGTAYLLPDAIEKLLSTGQLVEVPGRKPPA